MKISFGWEFDGTAWDSSGDSFGRLVCGPRELIRLLATRLGLARPEANQAVRIAAYRGAAAAAISTGHGQWFAPSFSLNPWAMASTMLGWRDFVVEHGWTPSTNDRLDLDGVAPAIKSAVFQRLHALAAVERELAHSDSWEPGHADMVAEVAARLSSLADSNWDLSLTAITIHAHTVDQLPQVWRDIFTILTNDFGVDIVERPTDSNLADVHIITSQTDYEAGLTAARILSGAAGKLPGVDSDDRSRPGLIPSQILTGAPSTTVDDELTKRGLPRLGVAADTQSPLLPVFLGAIFAPRAVSSLVALLTMSLPSARGPVPLFPDYVTGRLLDALGRSPGIGTAETPAKAWADAIEKLAEYDDDYALALDLDRILRVEALDAASDSISSDDVADQLRWLERHLAAMERNGVYVSQLRADIKQFIELLNLTGPVHAQEFAAMINSLSAHAGYAPAEASDNWTVSTRPGQLPIPSDNQATLLWWAPIADTSRPAYPLTELEVHALAAAGVEVPDARMLATLSSASQLDKLHNYHTIIAVQPEYYAGEATRLHPLMNLLTDDIRAATPKLSDLDVEDALKKLSSSSATMTKEGYWAKRLEPVEARQLNPGNPIERTFKRGSSFIPERLSFSQIDRIIHHPLEWLFEYGLGIRPSAIRNLSTGNAMVGTLMHAVHERLAGQVITKESVGKAFDALVPEFASELDLPENKALRSRYRATTVRALTDFARLLSTHSIEVVGREQKFEQPLPELLDAAGHDVTLTGFRDIDISASGRTGVIDLKYTLNKSKFAQQIANGEAVQLATYARSFADGPEGLDHHPVSYYSLSQSQSFPQPGAGVDIHNPQALDELWAKVISHLSLFLEHLKDGKIFDIDNYRLALEAKVIDGQDEEWMDLHARYRDEGFYSLEPDKYTNFDFLTGKAGDFQ